jgi:hypothetical protein
MEITEARHQQIEDRLPRQRGNVSLTNLQALNAIFGRWHRVYTRMSRWSKADVLDRVFEKLQRAQIIQKLLTFLLVETVPQPTNKGKSMGYNI